MYVDPLLTKGCVTLIDLGAWGSLGSKAVVVVVVVVRDKLVVAS